MRQLAIGSYTATSAAGIGLDALRASLKERRSGLRRNDFEHCDLDSWIGRIDGLESVTLPPGLEHLASRNNQLAWLGLQQDDFLAAIGRLRDTLAPGRIGVIVGTSTSSIGRTEEAYRNLLPTGSMPAAYRQPDVHTLHSPGIFVTAATGLEGPSMTVSTACSSSAKVFASAARWIENGIVDAVLVGGVDSLCLSILYGFNSLQLISKSPCRPFDRRRNGINLGEACGFAILASTDVLPEARLSLAGYGESSDAYHMAHPHPEGKGALLAMDRALERAALPPDAIGYVNLHGTATPANDRIETRVLAQRFSTKTVASSSKGWTGHALGAAGILESVITLEALAHGLVPGTLNCEEPDPAMAFPVMLENEHRDLRFAVCNSFGFGGSNASLVLGRLDG